MPTMVAGKVFERRSEVVMFLAGALLLVSVATITATESFVLWKTVKFLYAVGVVLILLDR